MGHNGDLRSGAGLAGNGFDFYGAVENFRHFLFKQAADKIRVRAGDDGLRALFGLLNVYNVDLYVVAFLDVFGTDLLSLRQNGFCLADLQGQRAGLRVYALYKGADELLMATLEFLHHLVALAVADALTDDVSCGLRCHTAKLFRIETVAYKAANLRARVVPLDDLKCNLAVRVFHFFYNLLAQEHVKLAAFRIHVDDNVFVAVAVLAGGGNGLLNLIDHEIDRDAFFRFEELQSLKQLLAVIVHFFFLRCFSCHFSNYLPSGIILSNFCIINGSLPGSVIIFDEVDAGTFFSGERDRGVLLGDDLKVAVFGNVDEDALELAHAVFKRANELYAHRRFKESLKVLRAGELAVDAGRGDLQGIFLRNGVFAVQHGVDGAGEVYAVVDAYAAFLVNKNAQIPIRALFRERNVPDYEPKLLCERLCQRAHDLRGAAFLFLCHTQLPFSARFSAAVSVLDIHPNTNKRAGRPTLSSSYYLTVKIIPQRCFFCKEKNKVFRTNTGVFLRFGTAFFTGCLPLPRKTTSVRFISRKTQKRTRRLFAVTSVVCAYFIPLRIQARRSCSLPHRPLRAYSAR